MANGPATKPREIVVAEDDPSLLSLVAEVLEDEGRPVVRATNGSEVLRHVSRSRTPALVVTDLVMPQMRGEELIDRLNAEPRTRAVPLLVLTADHERAAQLAARRVTVIRKPFDLGALARAARYLLRRAVMPPLVDHVCVPAAHKRGPGVVSIRAGRWAYCPSAGPESGDHEWSAAA